MATVLLDCDGVLADFVGHMLARLGELGHAVPAQVDDYDFMRGLGDGPNKASKMLMADPAHWLAIPPFEDARDGVAAINDAGHDVVVVTAPWTSCDAWCSVRRRWLKRHFDVEARNVIVTSRKELVVGDVFIDDKHESVSDWRNKHSGHLKHALLMDRSWTKTAPGHLVRFTWASEDVQKLLRVLG